MNSHRNNFSPTMSIQNYDALQGEEVLAKRSRFGKVFALGGNRFQAVTYSEPVHRFDHAKQEWVEIDNTFKMPEKIREAMVQWGKTARLAADQREMLASETILEAHGGDMNVICGIAGSNPFIILTDEQNRKLAWGIEGAESILPTNKDDSFHAEKSAAPINIREHRERIVRQTNGAIEYTDIFPGVDLCCHLGRRFKDDITFKAQESARPIIFNLAIDSAHTIRSNSDHSLDVIDEANELIFHLPAPFLMDAAGHFGTVNVELEQADGKYRMVCTPDPEYMATAAYPVILDPAVETAQQGSAIEDTYIIQNDPSNNSNANLLHVGANTSGGNRHIYIRVKTLPPLGSNHFITKAYMCVRPLIRPSSDTRLMAREVLGNWSESTITFANQPAYGSLWQDYCTVRANTDNWCQIDVTSLARKWYLGTNYGIMFPPAIEHPTQLYLHSTTNSSPPYFVINYASLAGLEDYLSYDKQSVGRAGTGHIGLLNGNLIFAHNDTSMNGLRMPVSITHYYNSCDANKNEFGMGYGWRTSLHHTLHKEYLSGTVYFVYTDGDGTEHYFEGSGSSYTDMSGLSLKLSVGSSNITITDKGNNVMTFPLVSGTPTASSPATSKVLITKLADATGNSVTIASSSLRISTVTDGAGRVTNFSYSSNLCSAIYTPWQTSSTGLRFTYSSSQLIKITYEDSRTSTFTYGTSGSYQLLLTATGPEGIKVTYTYANRNATDGLPHTVTKAVVTGGSLTGTNTSYEYGNHLTRVIDNLSGKAVRYHFNDNGNEVSVDDELGYAAYTRYDQTGSNSSAPINHATLRSRMQKVVHNLLVDSSFENASSVWNSSGSGTFYRDQFTYQWGLVSMRITTNSTSSATYYQTVNLTPGKSYTLSGYAKSEAPLACVQIGYTVSGTTTYLKSDPVPIGTADGFKRISVSFTLPSNASSSVTAAAVAYNAAGNAWFDCMQLEEGLTCNHYNLLHNSNFAMTGEGQHLPDRWGMPNGTSLTYISYQPLSSCAVTPPSFLTGNAIHMVGKYDRDMRFQQEFRAYGNAGDTFSAGGWCSCFAKETDADNYIYCRINVLFTGDGTNYASGGSIIWNYEEGNWQFASGNIVAPHQYIAIRFQVQYSCQVNYADVTALYIYPEQFGTEYIYDAKGNAKSSKALFGKTESAAYDSFNNMTSYTAPGKSVSTTFNYGSTDAEKKKHLLLYSVSPLGTKTTNTYNSYGSPTAVNVSDNSGGTSAFMKTTTTYTSNSNYVSKQTDARGKTVTTVIDANKGTTTSVTDPNSQAVSYTYDTLRRPTKVTTTVDSKEYKNEYAYNSTTGYLTTVKHNTSSSTSGDVTYTFAYDALGRPTTVKVGSTTLSTNTYNSTGTLAKTTFGNGGVISNVYDGWKRLTGVKYDSDSSARYTYTYNANGQVAHVKDTTLNRVTETEYDLANRPCRKKTHDGTSHVYTGELAYDATTGNLSKFAERVGTGYTAYQTTFGYDNENRPTTLTYGSYGKTTNSFDKLGRVTSRGLTVGSGSAKSASYTYLAGGQGTNSTTGLVQKITQYSTTLTYAYDNVGNITSVADGSKTVSYVYDKLGQLTRANDPYDTTAGSSGTTWVYTYDQGGNITQKVAYAYTTGTVGTAVQTIPYTYGDSNWKDKLTAYNGTAISYDAIGNPTSDGTWTYTWAKGRQLQKMTKSGETATFTYNSDGLRVKKVCTTTGTTNYILHGKNIAHLTNGSNALHFFYDAQNRPAIVVFNGTAYGYVHNLQGDIIAIVDSAGTKVVEYKYDAWGKPLSKTGTMASTLGKWNPFRYRGYVYDEETNLYYLRSRYYNSIQHRFINLDWILGRIAQIMTHNLFCYCNNSPIVNTDPSGCISANALASIGKAFSSLLQHAISLAKETLSRNQLIGSYLVYNGKVYSIEPYKWDGPVFLPTPNTLARGQGSATTFSWRMLGVNFANHDFENVGLGYIAANANMTTTIDITIFQYGDMEPRASVWVSMSWMNADATHGYHNQQFLNSGRLRICGKNGNEYILQDLDGNQYCSSDEESWIDSAFNAIVWE